MTLESLGLELGADVPVFVHGKNAFGEGVGELLSPVCLPDAWYVLVVPPVVAPTAQVFSDPDLRRDTPRISLSDWHLDVCDNDLEPVAVRLFPDIAVALECLNLFGMARMSGSGATVFAEFDSEFEARQVWRDLQTKLPPRFKNIVCRGLKEHPLAFM